MAIFTNPFDPDARLGRGCSCGRHASQAEHDGRDVQSRDSFGQAQSGSTEGISVRHRQIVKDYFMQLRETKP